LYSTTASGNKTVIGTIDWREDTYMPSQINDNLGQIMADIRNLANSIANGWIEIGDGDGVYTAQWSATNQFAFVGVNVTNFYRVGMRVAVIGPVTGTVTGTVTGCSFSTHTYVSIAPDSGGLTVNEVYTAIYHAVGGADAAINPGLTSKSCRNILGRNGGLEVWQRGAGGSAGIAVPVVGAYTADGWFYFTSNNQLGSVNQVTPGIATGSRYAAQIMRWTGQTGVATLYFEFPLDSDEIAPMRGQTVTLSFTAKSDGSFSPAGGTIGAALQVGTGSPARATAGAGFTGSSQPLAGSCNLTTTATRFTITSSVVVPTTSTQASVLFSWTPVGTSVNNDHWYLDDVQLEVGSVATPFERRPFEQELAACRRYFWKTFPYETAPANNAGVTASWIFLQTVAPLTAMASPSLFFPTPMRSAPTLTAFNFSAFVAGQARNVNVPQDCTSTTLYPVYNQVYATCQTPAASAIGHQIAVHVTADAGI
jgi:hypothetical protein